MAIRIDGMPVAGPPALDTRRSATSRCTIPSADSTVHSRCDGLTQQAELERVDLLQQLIEGRELQIETLRRGAGRPGDRTDADVGFLGRRHQQLPGGFDQLRPEPGPLAAPVPRPGGWPVVHLTNHTRVYIVMSRRTSTYDCLPSEGP